MLLVSPPPTILNSHRTLAELKVCSSTQFYYLYTQIFYIWKHPGHEVWVPMTKATSQKPLCLLLPKTTFKCVTNLKHSLSVGSTRDAFLNPNQSLQIAAGENSSYVLAVHAGKSAWSYRHRPVLPFISGQKRKYFGFFNVFCSFKAASGKAGYFPDSYIGWICNAQKGQQLKKN